LRSEEGELRLITTLTSFATAVDVTLAELHLEAFLPEDDATARILQERCRRADADAHGALPRELVVGRRVSSWRRGGRTPTRRRR